MGNKDFTIRPFEKLRKKIAHKQQEAFPAPLQKKENVTDEELFTSAMDDVQAIEAFRRLSCRRSTDGKRSFPATRRDPEDEIQEILSEITAGTRPINLADTQEYVEWTNPDYGNFLTEQLHEGHFSVQDFLDLHGFTVPESEAELDAFFQDAFVKGLRCIKVIHGRGLRSPRGPRIKDAVIRRLLGRYRKQVIAFASARQCDGGLGAIYVLFANAK